MVLHLLSAYESTVRRSLLIGDPANLLAIVPLSDLALSIGHEVLSSSMLFALFPTALVLAAIGPCEGAKAVLLIFQVFSLIDPTIYPSGDSVSVHLVVLPLALILLVVVPHIHTCIDRPVPFP